MLTITVKDAKGNVVRTFKAEATNVGETVQWQFGLRGYGADKFCQHGWTIEIGVV